MEINNEIVRLRQCIRQARICVINKLIREAKRLRNGKGNEKQLEKNKNKADKLLREVFALKGIKDDEISKFGITRFKCLQDILQSTNTDDGTRAMAKVVLYKSLSSKIIKFQEKFPGYNEHTSLRKWRYSSKRKKHCVTDFPEKHSNQLQCDTNNTVEKVYEENTKVAGDVTSSANVPCEKRRKVNGECERLSEGRELNTEAKDDGGNSRRILKTQDAEIDSRTDQSSKTVTKVISNEATVKPFMEVLQETEEETGKYKETKNQQCCNETAESLKDTDEFFLHRNKVTLSSNGTLFSKEINTSGQHHISRDIFKLREIKEKKYKLYNEKTCKERKEGRGRKMNCANISYDQSGVTERSDTRWKQNKKDTQAKGNEKINKIICPEHENLHPSWIAKRKQQDIMKQGFQGKKIKFDEN
ncbi:serum response factor-binding protein 1-like [Bombus pascuorum]|uniref:serum response factor-binding protein 1-like n=1 Tax=Bombus pascuorum TaxID=65598 RepID=UPI0021380A5E|nr:serum response factor-binding protein 1-like [Bombus pascuorum]